MTLTEEPDAEQARRMKEVLRPKTPFYGAPCIACDSKDLIVRYRSWSGVKHLECRCCNLRFKRHEH